MITPISHEAVVKTLEARVAALEKALQVSANQIVLQIGTAKITLSVSGEVHITSGGNTQLTSARDTWIKAAGNLVMKASQIKEN